MIATSPSASGSPHASMDAAACSGFREERGKITRSGSPAPATSRPVASHTATCPRCTDSSTPERTTRASTTGSVTGGASGGGGLGEVFLVATLQLTLERVVDGDDGGPGLGDRALLFEQPSLRGR